MSAVQAVAGPRGGTPGERGAMEADVLESTLASSELEMAFDMVAGLIALFSCMSLSL